MNTAKEMSKCPAFCQEPRTKLSLTTNHENLCKYHKYFRKKCNEIMMRFKQQ